MATKVVLVTGCSEGGIGYSICKAFAEKGCIVHATARRAESMTSLTKLDIQTHVLDVTSDEQTQRVVDSILKREGRLDIVVCNAGVHCLGPVVDITPTQAAQVFDTNVLAPLRMARAVMPHMASRRSGVIINIGSSVGEIPIPFSGLYCASKAAVHSMTRVLTEEARPFGVSVMLAAPAAVRSHLADNHAPTYELPEDSLYKSYKDKIIRRLYSSQQADSMDTDKYARMLVERALRKKVPQFWHEGGGVWRFKIMVWLPMTLAMSITWYIVAVA